MERKRIKEELKEELKKFNHLYHLAYGGLRAILDRATRPTAVEAMYNDVTKRAKGSKEKNHDQ